MTSEVDIVNLALSRLGNRATVSSIDPPEGSAEAAHCAIFYPMARDSLLQMGTWAFATRRVTLALLSSTPPSEWGYAYGVPTDKLRILAVTSSDATDDYSMGVTPPFTSFDTLSQIGFGTYTPQPYVLESLDDDSPVIYTNQEDAVLRYTAGVVDATHFPPLFVDTVSTLLASYLAGPILKGAEGRKVSASLMQEAMAKLSMSNTIDANQRRAVVAHNVPWMSNR